WRGIHGLACERRSTPPCRGRSPWYLPEGHRRDAGPFGNSGNVETGTPRLVLSFDDNEVTIANSLVPHRGKPAGKLDGHAPVFGLVVGPAASGFAAGPALAAGAHGCVRRWRRAVGPFLDVRFRWRAGRHGRGSRERT